MTTPMEVAQQLDQCGLVLSGDPPSTTVAVAGTEVTVTLAATATALHLQATVGCAAATGAPDALEAASASAPGDTRFRGDAESVVGERTLAAPDLGVLYDAVHELAKASAVLALVLDDMAAARARLASLPQRIEAVPAAPPAAPLPPPPAAPAPSEVPVEVPVEPAAPAGEPAPPPPPSAAPAAAPATGSQHGTWVYVERSVPVRGARETDKVVGALQPGRWYRAQEEARGWVYVVDHETGLQGWVDGAALRRRG